MTTSNTPPTQWNAELYDKKHSFVSRYGADLLELLEPKSGDRILDLGCGTGHLTQQIAATGAEVVGVDSSPNMIEQARHYYSNISFEVINGENLTFFQEFDGVFSNAALHWMKAAEKVVAGIYQALKPGGRFVAEFGGKGNVGAIATASSAAMHAAGYPLDESANPWYFPSIGEYATVLETQGFEVSFAQLFDRPTPLEDGDNGLRNWLQMFGSSLFATIPESAQSQIIENIENQLRSQLYREGTWVADYRRIRVMAHKPN